MRSKCEFTRNHAKIVENYQLKNENLRNTKEIWSISRNLVHPSSNLELILPQKTDIFMKRTFVDYSKLQLMLRNAA